MRWILGFLAAALALSPAESPRGGRQELESYLLESTGRIIGNPMDESDVLARVQLIRGYAVKILSENEDELRALVIYQVIGEQIYDEITHAYRPGRVSPPRPVERAYVLRKSGVRWTLEPPNTAEYFLRTREPR